ncbi:hypothetical protein F443_05651 [Phytophthora nicotianae P1569]|uniref:Uncharacterized protein n=1 Tax=Phytophthora nicotianae P1569 TaxID=1317065 RepID=V9FIL4_PHYNI|nr:hypothetical protein F443_05651 [Phytophthora nicotianae P1569]
MFKLEPISLERIHALEVKIRDLEELQLAQKRSPSRRDNQMVHLDAITNNNALVNDGQWNVFDTNGFELSDSKTEIRCCFLCLQHILEGGCYAAGSRVGAAPTAAKLMG